jgi:hypothetical protein
MVSCTCRVRVGSDEDSVFCAEIYICTYISIDMYPLIS